MITSSSSQYLHPDYLQPLPSTLDAKNSPLALLAQTCSSIGKDPTPTKTSGQSQDRKDSSSHVKDTSTSRSKSESPGGGPGIKSSSSEERSKSRTSSGGSDKKDGLAFAHSGSRTCGSKGSSSPKSGFRVPPPPSKDSGLTERISGRGTPSTEVLGGSGSHPSGRSSHQHSISALSSAPNTASSSNVPNGGGVSTGKTAYDLLHEVAGSGGLHKSLQAQQSLSASMHHFYGSLKLDGLGGLTAAHAGLAPSLAGFYPPGLALPFLGPHPGLDPLAAAYSASIAAHCSNFAAAAAAQQQKSLTSGGSVGHCGGGALSPYVSYARVKTASGATTLVPVCKDPYCAHCQLTVHGAQLLATNTPACTDTSCTQCLTGSQHDKVLNSTGVAASVASGLGGLQFFPGVTSMQALSSFCPHAFTGGLSTSGGGSGGLPSPHGGAGSAVSPYVCSWVHGNDYCGKRFPNSEELLQHLRTHTSSMEAALASPFNAGGFTLPSAAAALSFSLPGLLGCYPHLSGLGSLSPVSAALSVGQSGYPRSLSPSSLLAAARYHPYKTPGAISTSAAGTSLSTPYPSLAAYYSPYALYGQRVGAAAVGP